MSQKWPENGYCVMAARSRAVGKTELIKSLYTTNVQILYYLTILLVHSTILESVSKNSKYRTWWVIIIIQYILVCSTNSLQHCEQP